MSAPDTCRASRRSRRRTRSGSTRSPPAPAWRSCATGRARTREHPCPILVCICDQDSLVDVKASDQVAHDAPQGEVAHYPIGHFDIYTGEWFERAVSRQSEFLARHLSA